jgi:hypothetical protein
VSDFVYGADLEQRCIRPGLWGIEGREVERMPGGYCRVVYFGEVVHTTRTLREARELIADDIEQQRKDQPP